ncbi:MAG TPA: pyruvate ferredoxin oxidoreductase [Elusimicrobia bacterium]|jgi:pyruvate ferredoxin oxidoreductase alpha subunit|nr:pyruvate ferredoxin oxidoreductase [Elusimicrobiota bacterium]
MKKTVIVEGSKAVSEAVKLCRPKVIAAYPITPQTHIVENLSQIVADGELDAEFVHVESEHSAASVVLGASATGVRTYTSSSSQGLLLLLEVLYNLAGMRLPVVIGCVNRAVSSPLNIWNDHQDAITARDAGIIQLWAEDAQEALDMHIQAYKIAENKEVLFPVIVNLDGYIISHTFEAVEIPTQEEVDSFLPPYQPEVYLTPKNPLSFGAFADWNYYQEVRQIMQETIEKSKEVILEITKDFAQHFGRDNGSLVEKYKTDDAETVVIAMGSICGIIKELVDELRNQGKKVGLLRIRVYRPFPKEEIYQALKNVKNIAVFERCLSVGSGGIVANEVKSVFYGKEKQPRISNFIGGLGGRDLPKDLFRGIVERAEKEVIENEFVAVRTELIKD